MEGGGMSGCKRCGKPKPPGRGRKLCDACSKDWQHKVSRKRCFRCGGPCEAKKILCSDCKELAEWRRAQRSKARRRKPCVRCGGPKGEGKRIRLCARCRAADEAPKKMCTRCRKRPKRYAGAKLCEPCHQEAIVTRAAYMRKRKREEYQKAKAAGKVKARRLKRKERQRVLENQRINARLRAERRGLKGPAELDQETYERMYGTGRGHTERRLPVAPLIPFMSTIEAIDEFADDIGVSESFVFRVLTGHYEAISIPDADRICVGLGVPLRLVYGEAA
jgi:hypothetical protein